MAVTMAKRQIVIKPQPGPQEAFLATPADVCIYGGAAGGGKTYGLLMEAMRPKSGPVLVPSYSGGTTLRLRHKAVFGIPAEAYTDISWCYVKKDPEIALGVSERGESELCTSRK